MPEPTATRVPARPLGRRAVARHVTGSGEMIEDACQFAWLKLIDSQPDRHSIFGRLCVVALHEAHRLSTVERRDARLERREPDHQGGCRATRSLSRVVYRQ